MAKDDISAKFKKERYELSLEIREAAEEMSSFKGLKDVQVKMLSLRQRLLESNHSLLEHLLSVRKKYREARGNELKDISTKSNYRYQANEKNVIIDGSTSATKEIIEILENQISFYVDSTKTVDNILYAIKTRVEIEKVLGL